MKNLRIASLTVCIIALLVMGYGLTVGVLPDWIIRVSGIIALTGLFLFGYGYAKSARKEKSSLTWQPGIQLLAAVVAAAVMVNRILLQETTDAVLWAIIAIILGAACIKGLRCRKKHPDSGI